ncbi:hypothetical protein BBJ28_00007698 [Nothophytophthora sp. Chile5]|nr:hypothetical protein BBJ28_00007698 [Nothophytophthora sp. Chile5]
MAKFPWRCVTLDATGTLLRPAERIGDTYLRFWERASGHQLSTSRRAAAAAAVTTRFPSAFSRLSKEQPNFGAGVASDSVASAYPWWHELILDVIAHADVAERIPEEVGERFTRELYAHYASPEAWTVYDDVIPTLETLRRQDVALGVISNFDERLEGLLRGLELREYFQVVTTSFNHPTMKPHASLFLSTFAALQEADSESDVDASQVLHVGDHRSKDYEAALAVGARARLLWRSSHRSPPDDVPKHDVIRSLEEITDASTLSEG